MIRILIAVALAALRVSGHKSEAFQAVAHLFIGWLLAAWWYSPVSYEGSGKAREYDRSSGLDLALVIVLSVIEVACAIWFKLQGAA
jgi:hypothetical protein